MSSRREQYREAARECIGIAEITSDLNLRKVLRQHAQEWLKLAYSEQDLHLMEGESVTDQCAASVQGLLHLRHQTPTSCVGGAAKGPPDRHCEKAMRRRHTLPVGT